MWQEIIEIAMEPKQHKSDCVNENSSFKRIRQQHGNIPPSALWNLFVKCNYNEDETMLTLHSELIPSSQGGKDCVCNCDLHEEMTEFGSQETYCEEIENEAMNAKITEFNNQETYCEEIENGAINMTTTSIRIPCADCEMVKRYKSSN